MPHEVMLFLISGGEPYVGKREAAALFLHAQHYTGLPPRAVKPLGSVLAPNQLYEAIPVPLKTRSFGQMQK